MCKSANWKQNRINVKVTSKTQIIKMYCGYMQKCEYKTKSDQVQSHIEDAIIKHCCKYVQKCELETKSYQS